MDWVVILFNNTDNNYFADFLFFLNTIWYTSYDMA